MMAQLTKRLSEPAGTCIGGLNKTIFPKTDIEFYVTIVIALKN
jgi:hypothetical protein